MKTVVFDFDGTIADSFEILLSSFQRITGHKMRLSNAEIKDLRGRKLNEILKYLKIKPWQIPRLALRAKREIAAQIDQIQTFPDLPETLEQLHKDGYKMYILSTNSRANIGKFLNNNRLDSYFISIYGDIGLRSKSSALKRILKKEKIAKEDSVYVGDEVRDIDAAKKAGITVVSVGWGFNFPHILEQSEPAALAKDPKDLLKILKSL